MHINAIAAIAKGNRAIGKNGKLVWTHREDMDRFKALTTGHPVIMGSKTWLSLPARFRPLPHRTNIVISRDLGLTRDALVSRSIEDALKGAAAYPGGEEIFVIGGGEIYKLALPFVDRLYLTIIETEMEGDVFFPEYEKNFRVIEEEKKDSFVFQTLERITPSN